MGSISEHRSQTAPGQHGTASPMRHPSKKRSKTQQSFMGQKFWLKLVPKLFGFYVLK